MGQYRIKSIRINVLFLMAAISMAYYFSEMRLGLTLTYENATPARLVEGTAAAPYQFRALLPWLVGGLLRLGITDAAVPQIFRLLEFLSSLSLVIAFRVFLSLFFKNRLLVSVLALSIFLVLPFNLLHTYWYPSDIPSVLFFTLGLILLYRRKWFWYYLLFVVASFNRETTLFLTFVFFFINLDQLSITRLAGHTAAQLVLWVLIKSAVQSIYPNNLGQGAIQLTLEDTLQFLLQPGGWFWVLPNWGLTWILALIGYRRLEDQFIKRSLWVIGPVFVVMLLVGKVDELRIYTELTPIVLTTALLSLQILFQQES
jgi:hypothetical protein